MPKFTRHKYFVAEKRGTTKTITEATTLTEANILKDGNSFIVIDGAYTLTLPAASGNLDGVSLIVHCNNASGKVAVVAGFGGGGGSYDTVTPGAYCSTRFWCDGTYWYALSEAVSSS
jgi:hypothetical protein